MGRKITFSGIYTVTVLSENGAFVGGELCNIWANGEQEKRMTLETFLVIFGEPERVMSQQQQMGNIVLGGVTWDVLKSTRGGGEGNNEGSTTQKPKPWSKMDSF